MRYLFLLDFLRAYRKNLEHRLPEVIFQLIFSPFGRPVDEVGSVNRPLVLFLPLESGLAHRQMDGPVAGKHTHGFWGRCQNSNLHV